MLTCGLCQKTACEDFHWKFLVSCKFCREKQCKACKKFNIAKDILFKSLDDIAKEHVNNFIRDFLSLSPESLQENYHATTETVCIPNEKNYFVKSYHKSNKNRSQVVYQKFDNCDKLNYSFKWQKRTFYKKKISLDNIKMSWLTNVATQSTQATQSSRESWWSSWSGLSQPFTSKGGKKDWSDDEKEQWWKSKSKHKKG